MQQMLDLAGVRLAFRVGADDLDGRQPVSDPGFRAGKRFPGLLGADGAGGA